MLLLNISTESIARDSHYSDTLQVTLGGGQGNSHSKDGTIVASKRVPSSTGRPVFSAPFLGDNNFTSREDILSLVEEQLKVTLPGRPLWYWRHRGILPFHLALSIC